jgi:pimeloyl-ACP methyl ester carboxylesterase
LRDNQKEAAVSNQHEVREHDGGLVDASVRERVLAEVPLTERRLELGGVSTAVLEGGDGPPVVLLHGQGEFAATWGPVVPGLMTTHRVIAPDLPGHGASEVVAGRLRAVQVIPWLGELIEQTCSTPPALIGHLLGGAIAARYTIDRPDQVTRLVLVDTFGLSRNRPRPKFAFSLMGFLARPTERTRDRLFNQCFADFDGMRDSMGERWDPVAAYALDRARAPGMKAALRSLMPQFGMRPIPPHELARIAVPTSLIWGRHDRQISLRVAQAASDRYGWPLHIIEGAADDPCFEQPEASLHALHAGLGTSTRRETAK